MSQEANAKNLKPFDSLANAVAGSPKYPSVTQEIISILQNYALSLGTTEYLRQPKIQRETVAALEAIIHKKMSQEATPEQILTKLIAATEHAGAYAGGVSKKVKEEVLSALEAHYNKRFEAAVPEKEIPHWRSHKGDTVDHARAIGHDKAIDQITTNWSRGK